MKKNDKVICVRLPNNYFINLYIINVGDILTIQYISDFSIVFKEYPYAFLPKEEKCFKKLDEIKTHNLTAFKLTKNIKFLEK